MFVHVKKCQGLIRVYISVVIHTRTTPNDNGYNIETLRPLRILTDDAKTKRSASMEVFYKVVTWA